MTQTNRGDLLIVLAAAIWGFAFYFQKTAMLHVGPFLFLGLRAAIATLALLPFATWEQRSASTNVFAVLPIAIAGGVTFFIAGSTQQFGIIDATVINTGFLTALYVVTTPFVFWVVERESVPRTGWIAAVLAFLGIWGLSGGSLGGLSAGDMLIALASVGWGLLFVIGARSARWGQPITYTCLQFGVVAILALTAALIWEDISWSAIANARTPILFVGLLSTALTFGVMTVALQYVSAPRAAVLLSTEVLFATAAGMLLLDENLPWIGWAGAAVVFAAILVVRLKPADQSPT